MLVFSENKPRREKLCVNCGNNIRTDENGRVVCRCKLDNHFISYIECMTIRCPSWSYDSQPALRLHKNTHSSR